MLRRERQEEKQHEQMRRDAAVLTIEFTKLSGGVVTFLADGRYLGDRTQMLLRKETPGAPKELAFKTDVKAELAIGVGEDQKTYLCEIPEMELDKDSDKPQWKQLGHDSTQLRLQVKFVRKCVTAPNHRSSPIPQRPTSAQPCVTLTPAPRCAEQSRRAEDDFWDWRHPCHCAAYVHRAAGRTTGRQSVMPPPTMEALAVANMRRLLRWWSCRGWRGLVVKQCGSGASEARRWCLSSA